jgi:hypothetical protein
MMEALKIFWGLEGHILVFQLAVLAPLGFILGGIVFRGGLGALAGALILAAGAAPALALVLLGGWSDLAAGTTAVLYYASPGNVIAFLGGLGLLAVQEARRSRH